MTEKTLTTENIKPALDALRGELAPWPVVAKKQDRLNTAQLNAANSGITSSLVAQIIANTAAIRALESAITGTGLRPIVVASLPAIGTQGILYIVPVTTYDPETDADVVNYSNEYIWIVAPDAPVTEGYYEQVGQTGIVINNGQLTITVNGTSVGTFTANQSGDTTAAITVPTNADYVDLTTNQTVAGVKTFSSTIDGTASKAIADEDGTSIKTGYVNVAGNQTVSGDKSFTGSNTFNNILPNATNTYALGSSSYQWSSVYAQTYYYNGTEFQSKFVTTDTNQEIGGTKTFTGSIRPYGLITHLNQSLEKGTIPSTNKYGGIIYNDKTFANNVTHRFADQVAVVDSRGIAAISFAAYKWETNSQLKTEIVLGYPLQGNTFLRLDTDEVIPGTTAVTDLGTSTNKWKTLNGINPGALSLPDVSASVVVDTTDWVYDGLTANLIKFNNAVQTFSGWLYITAQNTSANDRIVVRYIGSDASNLTFIGGKFDGASSIFVACPIVAGVSTYVWSTKALNTIKIYKAQGNV